MWVNHTALIILWLALALPAAALELPAPEGQPEHRIDGVDLPAPKPKHEVENPDWHYGGFADLGKV